MRKETQMKVRVKWMTTTTYEAVIEVDDLDEIPVEIGDSEEKGDAIVLERQPRVILEKQVEDTRNVMLPDVRARHYEDDWED